MAALKLQSNCDAYMALQIFIQPEKEGNSIISDPKLDNLHQPEEIAL